MKTPKEHAGGGAEYEWQDGLAHPIVPFDYGSLSNEAAPDCYSMEDLAEALNSVVRWIVHDGNFQQRGVYNRAIVLCFMMRAPGVRLNTQAALAKRLQLSRSQTNALVRDFTTHFNFPTTAQRIRRDSAGPSSKAPSR